MEQVKQRLQNDQFAERCGIELLSISPGRATARMTLQPHHLNGIGTVQGGAIFTLADFAFAAASNSHGTVAVAVNASITFMKAARDGHPLGRGARNCPRTSKSAPIPSKSRTTKATWSPTSKAWPIGRRTSSDLTEPGIHGHNQPDRRCQNQAMLEREAKKPGLVGDGQTGCRRRHSDA